MTTVSSRAVLFSRLTDLSNRHHKLPPYPYSHHLLPHPLLPYLPTAATSKKRPGPASSISCLISGVDGGGLSGEFVSTNSFYHEFSVIVDMLKKIEPLDTSVISKGVSDSVKDSMKQMISTMLGLLPVDQFSVTVRVSKRRLLRLLASSLITGYTLWNAEYRIMLTRNFETSSTNLPKRLNSGGDSDTLEDQIEEEVCDNSGEMEHCCEEIERLNFKGGLADLSPYAMKYIQELESELSIAKQDLHTLKQETMQIGHARENNNDLLKYLQSLDSHMVNELSRPSSSEVKEVLQQLAYCTSRRVFKEDGASGLMHHSEVRIQQNYKNSNIYLCETWDYLAKLLFWGMLLGHQLRGLENRLYLSCAVGFL